MKKIFFSIIVIILGLAVYTQRTSLRELWVESQKPNIEAVSYQQVQQEKAEEGEKVEGIEEVEDHSQPAETEATPTTTKPPVTSNPSPSSPVTSTPDASSDLPSQFNLAIPFTSQAPHSNWDEVHEETCEEAASLMAAYFLQGKPAGKITPDEAEAQLQQIVTYENSFFGYYKDTTAAETALLIETYFHLTAEVVQNPTVDDLKRFVSLGYPVLVPTAGRQLGNPNFTPPGPIYHMVVLKGYTTDTFITNDPGTRLGADYTYDQDIFMNAIHDWNGGDVENGAKVVVVVKP